MLLPCSQRLLRSLLPHKMRCAICVGDGYVPCERLPRFQGIKAAPSGLFPWIRERPIGSVLADILDLLIVLKNKSLIWECLVCLGPLFRHDRPWSPLASIIAPQMHMYGWQVIQPSLNPTATRIASSDRRRQIAVICGAFNQSPACGAATTLILAVSASVSHHVC